MEQHVHQAPGTPFDTIWCVKKLNIIPRCMKTNPVIERNEQHPSYTLKQLVLYFLRLGYAGFGGPVALVGYMHRDLVEERKWITEEEYKEGLTLAQLAPGPA